MEEIKENDYIRTKKKGIFKVLSIKKTAYGYLCGTTDNDNISTFTIGKGGNAEIKNDIVKHSSNIIDLIEIGDFVNGRLVLQVDYKNKNVCLLIPLTDTKANTNIMWYGYEDIKTVVTKEQFANAEYRLEE